MALPKDKDGRPSREKREAAGSTRDQQRKHSRKVLQRPSGDLSDSHVQAAGHGEDPPPPEFNGATPREDRAG